MLVFISYRRADSDDIVGRIYDRLVKRFGKESVFKDVDAIPLGADFRIAIDNSLGSCQLLLAVIGQDWLTITEDNGVRRLDNPRDYVRLEVEMALDRGIPVIPVLVRRAIMPSSTDLPLAIRSLAYCNGISVRSDPDFHRDIDRLIEQIELLIQGKQVDISSLEESKIVPILDFIDNEKKRNLDSKKVSSSPLPKELVEIQHTVNCTVQKYDKEVPVENTLQMILQDDRRYLFLARQSPHLTNLEAWVKGKLEKIIKPLLFDKKYADILEDFYHESEKIKQEMQSEAEAIGYAIKHIVSLPKLEHLSLKEKIEIKDEKAEFSTNEPRTQVELTTTASIKLQTFAKIEDDLNKTVDEIKELMRKTVHGTTQEKLRAIAPERFYMRFYETTSDKKSVEEILKDSVKEALEDRFGATVSSVIPIPEETEIINYMQRLMGRIDSFETEIFSLTGGVPVKFQGDFRIIGVEKGSWYTFQSRFQSRQKLQLQLQQKLDVLQKYHLKMIEDDLAIEIYEFFQALRQEINKIENEILSLDDIRSSIEESIKAKLITFDSEVLRSTDIQELLTMEKYINQWASQSVIEQHGLDIIISHFRRTRN